MVRGRDPRAVTPKGAQTALAGKEERSSASAVLRTVLALLVIASHAPALLTGEHKSQPLTFPGIGNLGDMAVNAFLAVSGFYVTRSALGQPGIASFARARAARLLPALWLHAVAGALAAGSLLSGEGPIAHLSNPAVWADAWRISIGMWQHYAITGSDGVLQGVFAHNPKVTWNDPLWTVKFEIYCYAISGGMAMIGPRTDGRRRILWMSALIMAAPALHRIAFGDGPFMPWERLPACYAIGSAVHLLAPRGRTLLAVAATASAATIANLSDVAAQPASWVALAALAIALSRLDLPWMRKDVPDVSYGLYVWAWPTSQVLIAMAPGAWTPLTLWTATSIAAGAIALFSWRMVESPMRRIMRARE